MNNKVKILAATIAAMTLAGCGDTIEVTKPDGKLGFESATTKSTRSVAYFSKEDAVKLKEIDSEVQELKAIVPSYTYDVKDYPVADKKFTFKYGDGSAIESAYKAHYEAFLEAQKQAEADYQKEYDKYAEEVATREKELSKVQGIYDEATANIKPTLTKIEELQAENKEQEKKFLEATSKMRTAFNDFIVKESIPVNKIGEYTLRNFSYWEKTCDQTGFEVGRWDSFQYSFQYDKDLCVMKKLNKLPDGFIDKFIADKDFTNLLEEQTKIQVAVMLKQGDLRLRNREVNGLKQQINELQGSVKNEEIIIRNKYNRSLRDMSRDVEKATSYLDRSKSYLERFVGNKEDKLANALKNHFGSGKYTEYSTAIRDYEYNALDKVIKFDNFDVTKNAGYNLLEFEVNEDKPYQIIFDKLENGRSELFAIDTVSFNGYVKKAKMESPITLESLSDNRDVRKMIRIDKVLTDETDLVKPRVTIKVASDLRSLNRDK